MNGGCDAISRDYCRLTLSPVADLSQAAPVDRVVLSEEPNLSAANPFLVRPGYVFAVS